MTSACINYHSPMQYLDLVWNQQRLGTIPKRLVEFGFFDKVGGLRGLDKLCCAAWSTSQGGSIPQHVFFS